MSPLVSELLGDIKRWIELPADLSVWGHQVDSGVYHAEPTAYTTRLRALQATGERTHILGADAYNACHILVFMMVIMVMRSEKE